MTNIAFALPELLFSLINNKNVRTVIVLKYLKLRSGSKTLKIVKCAVRSEPKSKERTDPAYYAFKNGSRRNDLTERL